MSGNSAAELSVLSETLSDARYLLSDRCSTGIAVQDRRATRAYAPGGEEIKPEPGSTLSTDRAFVVHFRVAIARGSEERAGRIEHIVSGQAARFGSWAELRAFVRHVLKELGTGSSRS